MEGPGEEEEDVPLPAGSSNDPPPAAVPPVPLVGRCRRQPRHEHAIGDYSAAEMLPPNQYIMYEDPNIPPLWKRLIREPGRRRYSSFGKWRGADPRPVGFWQDKKGRWFFSRGPAEECAITALLSRNPCAVA